MVCIENQIYHASEQDDCYGRYDYIVEAMLTC